MSKRLICGAILMLFLLLLLVYAKPSDEDEVVANAAPPVVMLEGKFYVNYGDALPSSVKVSESQILGHISSVIPPESRTQMPGKDQEANFPAGQDAPYARCPLEEYPDGFVVFFTHQWYIFLPLEELDT